MKQPDRFEKLVLDKCTPDFLVDKDDAIHLLRRQHRAYVRMVKHYLDQERTGLKKSDFMQACELILEDFTRYKAGKHSAPRRIERSNGNRQQNERQRGCRRRCILARRS